MNRLIVIIGLAGRSLLNRKSSLILTLISIALSVALLAGVERIRAEARSSFAKTISNTDLIVGARSGPIQLLLYAVFRMGQPTINVSWSSFEKISASPDVAWSVPMALGDAHRGYRVMGTTNDYFRYYQFAGSQKLELKAGQIFAGDLQVVLGSEVAASLNYSVGQNIVLSHGLAAGSFLQHGQHPLQVVGVLRASGTPVDKTVHIPLAAVAAIHEHAEAAATTSVSSDHPVSITAFLLGMKSRAATLPMQRAINNYSEEALTAVLPGVALQELWSLVRVAERALLAVSAGVVVAGLFGLLSALLTSLNERRREMAILRAVGARPWHILALLISESALVACAGSVIGLGLAYALLASLRPLISRELNIYLGFYNPGGFDLALVLIVTCLAMLFALWPALRAYRNSLNDGLVTRL